MEGSECKLFCLAFKILLKELRKNVGSPLWIRSCETFSQPTYSRHNTSLKYKEHKQVENAIRSYNPTKHILHQYNTRKNPRD
jgi:hypothetical protein